MPTEKTGISLTDQRTIRFAVGTSATLAFSQAFAWEHSYLAAVFAAMFLTLPLPPPRLKGGLVFLLILAGALLGGLILLGPLKHYEFAGLLILGVSFFAVFAYSLGGGNPLVTSLAIAGLAAVPVVGVLSIPAAITICESLMKAGLVALLAMWLFHALFPDPPPSGPAAAPPVPAALPQPPE